MLKASISSSNKRKSPPTRQPHIDIDGRVDKMDSEVDRAFGIYKSRHGHQTKTVLHVYHAVTEEYIASLSRKDGTDRLVRLENLHYELDLTKDVLLKNVKVEAFPKGVEGK